jgi:glycosyltransferase involved in cell wall biosynthesis
LSSTLLIDIGPAVGGHGQRGIGRYVTGLASSVATFPDDLLERVWAVGSPGPALDSFGSRALRFDAIRGLRLVPPWAAGRIATDVACQRSGARVLHATDPQRPWTNRAVASIVTVYDLIPMREPGLLASWRLDHQQIYRWYIRQIKFAARILTISQTTAQDVHECLGIPLDRIDVVYPLVARPATVHRTDSVEPTFLVVGALDAHKQPDLALHAFGQFRARSGFGRLRYVGPSEPAQARRLRELARKLGLEEWVSFEGRIPDDQLENAYGAATALLAVSRIEGFGLPAVEAAIRGVPVIAVETRASTETLGDAALMVPADPEAIAHAMAHPVTPSGPAVSKMRNRYSMVSVAGALADIYRRILG